MAKPSLRTAFTKHKKPDTAPVTAEQPRTHDDTEKRARKVLGWYTYLDTIKQVKILSAENGVRQNELINEAMNDIFRKYNKPPIA